MPFAGLHVDNNESASRYELHDAAGQLLGIADYHLRDRVTVLPHTEIDVDHRGQGLGALLVRAVLDDVRAAGGKIDPRCWFVAAFVREHPEYADLVAGPGAEVA